MLENQVLNLLWVFEEDLNRLKWWTLCTPLVMLVTGDWRATCARSLASPKPVHLRGYFCLGDLPLLPQLLARYW